MGNSLGRFTLKQSRFRSPIMGGFVPVVGSLAAWHLLGLAFPSLFGGSWFLVPSNILAMLKAAFGLGFVIFVHELGHFLVAKACGVKCEKFYVGFDVPIEIGPIKLPKALFSKQVGETEYGIGIIPLGGYVKMLGQDDNPANAAAEAERIQLKKESGDVADDDEIELDPRSYPAKSVLQRMAIISAGVVMNLIFAVIFAAVAYRMGVSYTPTTIGGTMPGHPAWLAGIEPGDKIIQLTKKGRRDEQLWFTRDLKYAVMAAGDEHDLELLVRRTDGSERWITVRPSTNLSQQGLPTIGVFSGSSTKVALNPIDDLSPAARSSLRDDDEIRQITVGDESFPIESEGEGGGQITRIMASHAEQDLTVTVARKAANEKGAGGSPDQRDKNLRAAGETLVTITIPSQHARDLGMLMQLGPVVHVQKGSPAEEAGIVKGDTLKAIDGQEIADPRRVDKMLATKIGSSVAIQLIRQEDGKPPVEMTLNVTPRAPIQVGATMPGGPMISESIGAAYVVDNEIAGVLPDSPAAKAGMAAGDRLLQVEYFVSEEDQATAQLKKLDEAEKAVRKSTDPKLSQSQSELVEKFSGNPIAKLEAMRLHEPILFADDDETSNVPWLFATLQRIPAEAQVRATFLHEGNQVIAEIRPVESTDLYLADRGLERKSESAVRTAIGLREAFRLGVTETKEGIKQVLFTLSRIDKLFTSLGGPGTIAVVATSEASQGWPRLLVFLTMLSANLAVLNFLPIPVLDGGHMMFLLWEGITGKPVPERYAFALTMVGLTFILGLMVFVIGMDIYRFGPTG